MRLLLAVVLVCLMVPLATAQAPPPQVRIAASPQNQAAQRHVMPETESALYEVLAEVQCNGEEAAGNTRVALAASHTSSIVSVLNPSSLQKSWTVPCERSAVTGALVQAFRSTLTVTATRNAPAFYDLPLTITATVTKTAAGLVPRQYPTSEGHAIVKPGYLPLIQVSPESIYQRAPGGSEVGYKVEVANLGNGPTVITMDLEPAGRHAPDEVKTGELHLKSAATDGPRSPWKKTHTIIALAPSQPGLYSFGVRFRGALDGTGSELTSDVSVVFVLEVRGILAVPGPEWPLLALAAVGTVLVRRRLSRA